MCREIVENVLSGTKAGFKATRNLVFNQKAERSTMNRQKSREIVDNMPSATKAGLKAILNFEHAIERKKKMENQKSNSTFSAILLTLILMVAAIWVSSAVAAEKKMVTDPTTGEMVTAPEYGGTITFIDNGSASAVTDQRVSGAAAKNVQLYLEKLGIANWALDRNVWSYNTQHLPDFTLTGRLAESWEQPDPLTFIFKIRQGVHWHDKPPMNGRELTAADVEWSFHRILGLGSGFTKPLDTVHGINLYNTKSVTATDKYTVVFELKSVALWALDRFLRGSGTAIPPPRGNRAIRRR